MDWTCDLDLSEGPRHVSCYYHVYFTKEETEVQTGAQAQEVGPKPGTLWVEGPWVPVITGPSLPTLSP